MLCGETGICRSRVFFSRINIYTYISCQHSKEVVSLRTDKIFRCCLHPSSQQPVLSSPLKLKCLLRGVKFHYVTFSLARKNVFIKTSILHAMFCMRHFIVYT